jgi:hypothetical protein
MDILGHSSNEQFQSDEGSQRAVAIPIPIHRTLTRENVSLGAASVPTLSIPSTLPPIPLSHSLPTVTATSPARSIQNDTEYWRNMCSICFDRYCEFSLPQCQDQFCRECMRHFLEETIRSKAWGFATLDIKCPVCYDPLTKDVWTRYADIKTLSLYEEYSKPSRVLTRFCGTCGEDLRVCGDIASSLDMKRR